MPAFVSLFMSLRSLYRSFLQFFPYPGIIIFSCLLFSNQLSATHIVGGEMNYRYLGGFLYEVRLTVYRDCYNGVAPFDNPASIGIFDNHDNLISTVAPFINDQQQVQNAINTPCLIPPQDVCYEVAHYIFTTSLPPREGGYSIVYQRCCRNSTIMNLAYVQSTGATYIATIPDSSLAIGNSNPVYNSEPPTFICQNAPFTYDLSATDPDGDSLVYELCTPLAGASSSNPNPNPPGSPPYDPVVFLPPYSLLNVLGGAPLTIDYHTGVVKATPVDNGQYVYGMKAKEYRNGIFIGETRRDLQVNVVPCPQITVASIFSPTIVCGSLGAAFTNNSYNGATFLWNFGDATTGGDTSSIKNPFYTYPDTGDYIATLVAYSGINPDCNDTAIGLVHVYPVFNAAFSITNERCKSNFDFKDLSYGIGGNATFWEWSFGDGQTTSVQSPGHTYTTPGLYDVQLVTSTDSSCLDTLRQTISVLQVPVASFEMNLDTCKRELAIHNTSEFASTYLWDFGDAYFTTDASPTHMYSASGTFDIRGSVVTDSGCVDTTGIHSITIPPLPTADFSQTVAPCDSVVSFANLSANANSMLWDFGDGILSDEFSPQHTYSLSGQIPVSLVVSSPYGCQDTTKKNIFFVSFKKAAFSTSLDSCSGLVSFNEVTQNAAFYHWDFGDGDSSTARNPIHKYPADGDYTVILKVNNETACTDSITHSTKYESPLGERVFVPDAFTPNADELNDLFKVSVIRPCDTYTLEVYNRWGEKVYETEDAAFAKWDGTHGGKNVESGIYIVVLKGSSFQKKAKLVLIR